MTDPLIAPVLDAKMNVAMAFNKFLYALRSDLNNAASALPWANLPSGIKPDFLARTKESVLSRRAPLMNEGLSKSTMPSEFSQAVVFTLPKSRMNPPPHGIFMGDPSPLLPWYVHHNGFAMKPTKGDLGYAFTNPFRALPAPQFKDVLTSWYCANNLEIMSALARAGIPGYATIKASQGDMEPMNTLALNVSLMSRAGQTPDQLVTSYSLELLAPQLLLAAYGPAADLITQPMYGKSFLLAAAANIVHTIAVNSVWSDGSTMKRPVLWDLPHITASLDLKPFTTAERLEVDVIANGINTGFAGTISIGGATIEGANVPLSTPDLSQRSSPLPSDLAASVQLASLSLNDQPTMTISKPEDLAFSKTANQSVAAPVLITKDHITGMTTLTQHLANLRRDGNEIA